MADEELLIGSCMVISGICANTSDFGIAFSHELRTHGMIDTMIGTMNEEELPSLAARATIEAVARIISTSIEGLEHFVGIGGVRCFERLMDLHLKDRVLQVGRPSVGRHTIHAVPRADSHTQFMQSPVRTVTHNSCCSPPCGHPTYGQSSM